MTRRRIAAIAAAGAVAAGGTGVALAKTRADDAKQREQAVLSDAAKRLGTDADKLRAALAAAEDAQLDADVKAGRLTQEQADAIKQRRTQSGSVLGGPGFHGPGFGPGGPRFGGPRRGPVGDLMAAAAKAIGITDAKLFEQLRAGKSLSDIAKANGKDYAGVKAAVRSAAQQELDAAVEAGKLTRAQANDMLSELSEHLDDGAIFRGPGRDHRGPPGP
jgi:hypothetical protein